MAKATYNADSASLPSFLSLPKVRPDLLEVACPRVLEPRSAPAGAAFLIALTA